MMDGVGRRLLQITQRNNLRAAPTISPQATSPLQTPPVPTQAIHSPSDLAANANIRSFSTQYEPEHQEDMSKMTNEELQDTSTIPGWDLIHTPPRKFPRGALVGKVVSTKMQKTVNVAVDRYKMAPKVRKRLRYTRKFMAHDEKEVANLGDLVMIVPSQKISKRKNFMLRKIVRPKGQLH